MDNYKYYGLFLTDESKDKLIFWMSGNIVTYCYWSYVVPIDKFNFDDTHSSILNALQ